MRDEASELEMREDFPFCRIDFVVAPIFSLSEESFSTVISSKFSSDTRAQDLFLLRSAEVEVDCL